MWLCLECLLCHRVLATGDFLYRQAEVNHAVSLGVVVLVAGSFLEEEGYIAILLQAHGTVRTLNRTQLLALGPSVGNVGRGIGSCWRDLFVPNCYITTVVMAGATLGLELQKELDHSTICLLCIDTEHFTIGTILTTILATIHCLVPDTAACSLVGIGKDIERTSALTTGTEQNLSVGKNVDLGFRCKGYGSLIASLPLPKKNENRCVRC